MNLNDFSKWLQRVKNLRGSEYFPYPLYIKRKCLCFYTKQTILGAVHVTYFACSNLLLLLVITVFCNERTLYSPNTPSPDPVDLHSGRCIAL